MCNVKFSPAHTLSLFSKVLLSVCLFWFLSFMLKTFLTYLVIFISYSCLKWGIKCELLEDSLQETCQKFDCYEAGMLESLHIQVAWPRILAKPSLPAILAGFQTSEAHSPKPSRPTQLWAKKHAVTSINTTQNKRITQPSLV